MASQSCEPIPQCGTGWEIASRKFEPKVVNDRPPRVEVTSALLQETKRPFGKGDLSGELGLGETACLSVLSQVEAKVETGKKFAQISVPEGSKPARSLIVMPSKWNG